MMANKTILLVAASVALNAVQAQSADAPNFEVNLIRYPQQVPMGLSVKLTAEVRNISGGSITIARGNPGFEIRFHIIRQDGKPIETIQRVGGELSPGYVVESLPPDWSTREQASFSGNHEPGIWRVTAVVSSHGPYIPRDSGGRVLDEVQGWEGEIKSETVTVEVVDPTGSDLDAYRELMQPLDYPHARILANHSSSTYAAYFVHGQIEGFVLSDPSFVMRAVQAGSFLRKDPVPDATSPLGWRTLSAEEAVAWRDKWFDIILSNHPDIWFADELRLRRALDKVAMKDVENASQNLQALAEKGLGMSRGRASDYLSLMIQQGMIERDSVDADLVAELSTTTAEK